VNSSASTYQHRITKCLPGWSLYHHLWWWLFIAAQPALVNTHVVYRQGDTLAINPDVEEEMQASHYVYVKAEPAQIVGWRNRDTSRTRPPETASQIGLHQEIALGVIHAIAQHVGAELITINNHPDDIGTNLATMHEALEAL
jgi:adenylate kinase